MGEFAKRVVFGLVAAPAFLACVWFGGWIFLSLLLIIVWIMQHELSALIRAGGAEVHFPWVVAFGTVVFLHHHIPFFREMMVFLLLLFVALELVVWPKGKLSRVPMTIFAGIYIPLLMSCLDLLRSWNGEQAGFYYVVLLLTMVWANDSFAYFGGRLFGKHAMAPSISPKKTWEGFFFGMIGAAGAFFAVIAIAPDYVGLLAAQLWPLIILLSVAGPVGDLSESRLKRHVNVKDSGTLLPGHGGMLDRFDAMLFCAPVFLIYLEFIRYF